MYCTIQYLHVGTPLNPPNPSRQAADRPTGSNKNMEKAAWTPNLTAWMLTMYICRFALP